MDLFSEFSAKAAEAVYEYIERIFSPRVDVKHLFRQ